VGFPEIDAFRDFGRLPKSTLGGCPLDVSLRHGWESVFQSHHANGHGFAQAG
jgi:hypothetical protein